MYEDAHVGFACACGLKCPPAWICICHFTSFSALGRHNLDRFDFFLPSAELPSLRLQSMEVSSPIVGIDFLLLYSLLRVEESSYDTTGELPRL
jgi:hypothetical protein